MVDFSTADGKDVLKIKKMMINNCSKDEINIECSILSHLKYPYNKSLKGHDLRQKYRQWLKKTAKKEGFL